MLPDSHPDEIERALYEADHVARVFDAVDEQDRLGRPFDLIHDHCGFTAFAMADRIDTPVLHTLHGPFTTETSEFYRQHAHKAAAVAISNSQRGAAPPELNVIGVVPNPIRVRDWPYCPEKKDYLLWLGRVVEDKGPHRAIAAARAAGVPIVLAGPVQPGQRGFFTREVLPQLDDCMVRYVGEVGGKTKLRLLAEARALLMPISWPEPFGMVMIEALSCGTPVIAFAQGAAPEIIRPGVTGFLVRDEAAMSAAISQLRRIDPAACRHDAHSRFDIGRVAAAYEQSYARVLLDRALSADRQPRRRSSG